MCTLRGCWRAKPHHLALLGLALALLVLAACQPSLPPTQPQPTLPPPTSTLLPTQPPATPAPLPTPTALIEARTVELEWPPRMRLGDSDVVRLALVPRGEGYEIQAEFPEHQLETQPLTIDRPGGYALYGLAQLDGVGFEIAPQKAQERLIPVGEGVTWRWTLTPRRPGQQRLAIALTLRWRQGTEAGQPVRESLVYSHALDVRVTSFLGMSGPQATRTGLLGLLFGGGLLSLALFSRPRPAPGALQTVRPNPDLTIEPHPGLELSDGEINLFQSLFRQYGRLLIEGEFLSGYSGARTFLAVPIRPDGRADAHTIVKVGDRGAIEREFRNYETFVKDTLPPVTARIQHPPVTVRGSRRAAVRYTFLGQQATTPTSLRQALLQDPDPAWLFTLFETFGPNWWMQRRAYTFRLAQEYDCLLPTYYVLEPAQGRGKVLDGRRPPPEPMLPLGETVTLRGFSRVELRADGRSLSLKGTPSPGQPPLRVRWMSLDPPLGATGRIVATRWTLLEEFVTGFDRLDLPDPLALLPDLLNTRVDGTQATIHGDLNLENILVGPGDIVWLIDFARTRDGHPLFDFAHLEAEIVAHVIAPQVASPQVFLDKLQSGDHPLLAAMQEIAWRCLFNPSNPREYDLARFMASVGALKFANLDRHPKYLLYLTAAHLARSL